MTDHIAKANHVIEWEGTKVVDSENNQRLEQVEEAIRISQSSHVMDCDQGGIQSEQHLQPFVYHEVIFW